MKKKIDAGVALYVCIWFSVLIGGVVLMAILDNNAKIDKDSYDSGYSVGYEEGYWEGYKKAKEVYGED